MAVAACTHDRDPAGVRRCEAAADEHHRWAVVHRAQVGRIFRVEHGE
jgi:hypothetical protein